MYLLLFFSIRKNVGRWGGGLVCCVVKNDGFFYLVGFVKGLGIKVYVSFGVNGGVGGG